MGAFLKNALAGSYVAEDGEIFLSLEDTSAPKVEVKKRKPRTIISNNLKPLTDSYIEDKNNTMDMVVLSEYGGKQKHMLANPRYGLPSLRSRGNECT